MKKLSIEEKARRYDKAIKLAKDSYSYPSYPGFIRADVVFPELKESEDEMIRKDLLYWLYSYKDGNETFVPAGDVDVWISYLEKQGKQQDHSKFLDSIQIGDQVTRNEDGVLVNLSQLKRVAKTEDKVEQKPAWSEEDKRCLTNAIRACEHMSDGVYDYSQSYIDAIKWLKSLRPQNTWKPSEEQMLAVRTAVNVVGKGTLNGEYLTKLYNDLKAL